MPPKGGERAPKEGEKRKGKAGKEKRGFELKVPKGTKDWEGKDMVIRDKIFSTITDVFKRHGAVTIDTPYVFALFPPPLAEKKQVNKHARQANIIDLGMLVSSSSAKSSRVNTVKTPN